MNLSEPPHTPEGLWTDAPAPNISLLKAYTQAKQSIARCIRAIRNHLAQLKRDDVAAQYQELMVKLAEDRFTLAVLGQFKRGKSSLMNAMLGRELLPTGVLPLTSAITVLCYGPTERLVVIRENALFPEELPASRLAEFVTERGNPGNVKRVKTARIEVPLAFLRQGLEFVDTPGVGSSIEANTATTYQFLPQCDAAIFVTSVDSPLSKTELDFLAGIRQHVRRVFFVVNKIDLLSSAEREDVLQYVRNTLAHLPQDQPVSLFPVSAHAGLKAKQTGSVEGYDDSGLQSLEDALATFLATEKATTFLDSVLDKVIRLVPAAMAASDTPAATGGFWQGMQRRLLEIKSRLRGCLQESESHPASDLRPVEIGPHVVLAANIGGATEEPPPKTTLDLRTRGCPVCDRLSKRMFDLFRKWQYVLSSEESAQATFAHSGGFCPLHTWQLVAIASPHGLSVGLPVLMDWLSRELSELASRGETDRVSALSNHVGRCAACEFLVCEEQAAVSQLAEIVHTEPGFTLYRQSQGVCLRHLVLLLSRVDGDALRAELLALTARRCGEWAEDMQNYAMKRDAIRRALLNRDEEDAYNRAVIHLAGAKALCVPWQDDSQL